MVKNVAILSTFILIGTSKLSTALWLSYIIDSFDFPTVNPRESLLLSVHMVV
jgi:hypothetical protein